MDVPRLLRPLSRVPRWAIFAFALTGLLLQAFGLYWDIWRHVVVGRESFFTPPHLVLYAGFGYVALAGIVGSIAGASAPRWAGPFSLRPPGPPGAGWLSRPLSRVRPGGPRPLTRRACP